MKDERPEISPEPPAVAGGGEEGPLQRANEPYLFRVENARSGDFAWLTERSGYVPLPDAVGLKAVDVDGRTIRGMVVYDGRTRTLAQMHVALEMPDAGKALLRPAFAYPFAVLGLRVLVAMVDASHEPAVAIAKRQGFTEAYRVRDGVEVGTDLILFELRRDDCRPLEAH